MNHKPDRIDGEKIGPDTVPQARLTNVKERFHFRRPMTFDYVYSCRIPCSTLLECLNRNLDPIKYDAEAYAYHPLRDPLDINTRLDGKLVSIRLTPYDESRRIIVTSKEYDPHAMNEFVRRIVYSDISMMDGSGVLTDDGFGTMSVRWNESGRSRLCITTKSVSGLLRRMSRTANGRYRVVSFLAGDGFGMSYHANGADDDTIEALLVHSDNMRDLSYLYIEDTTLRNGVMMMAYPPDGYSHSVQITSENNPTPWLESILRPEEWTSASFHKKTDQKEGTLQGSVIEKNTEQAHDTKPVRKTLAQVDVNDASAVAFVISQYDIDGAKEEAKTLTEAKALFDGTVSIIGRRFGGLTATSYKVSVTTAYESVMSNAIQVARILEGTSDTSNNDVRQAITELTEQDGETVKAMASLYHRLLTLDVKSDISKADAIVNDIKDMTDRLDAYRETA